MQRSQQQKPRPSKNVNHHSRNSHSTVAACLPLFPSRHHVSVANLPLRPPHYHVSGANLPPQSASATCLSAHHKLSCPNPNSAQSGSTDARTKRQYQLITSSLAHSPPPSSTLKHKHNCQEQASSHCTKARSPCLNKTPTSPHSRTPQTTAADHSQ
jgi:hypothetical protein